MPAITRLFSLEDLRFGKPLSPPLTLEVGITDINWFEPEQLFMLPWCTWTQHSNIPLTEPWNAAFRSTPKNLQDTPK